MMIKRLYLYFKEMSLVGYLPISFINIYASWIVIQHTNSLNFSYGVNLIGPSISLFCLLMLIRIMDEFKDYEDDLVNFPDRPLPSGKVLKKDLLILAVLCAIIPVALNFKNPLSLLGIGVVLIFSFLMLKWFFMEAKMRKSLIFAFVTHHPIVLIYNAYYLLAFPLFDNVNPLSSYLAILPIAL